MTARGGRMAWQLRSLAGVATAGVCGLAAIPAAAAPGNMVILQGFEWEWDDIERRMPDVFMAGYNGFWLPSASFASHQSAGYDPFDKFSLGEPPLLTNSSSRVRTTFGTEATYIAMIEEAHRANALVYAEGIFNHAGGRRSDDAFYAEGGWPGFYTPRNAPPSTKGPGDDWGDFHDGSSGSETEGDLAGLQDIAHEVDHDFIRHPVDAGDPDNIPAGTIRNLPDAGNVRHYPDRNATPVAFTNPGTFRHPTSYLVTRFPFRADAPETGDPIEETVSEMLARWAQKQIEVYGVDGFRLDAQKHVPTEFWDTDFDAAMFLLRTDAHGNQVTPLSFGENVTGNFDMLNRFVRKDGFGNRDSLDIQGAARLRDLNGAGGFGSWGDIISNADSSHLDVADDGIVNGSMGINHVFSHDNGSVGNGGSLPPLPTVQQYAMAQHAYMLLRPGRTLVYHHARGVPRSSGFYPREGTPNALGADPSGLGLDDAMTTLVKLHNQVGHGQYFPLNGNTSDVLIYQRAVNGQANCLVGVNDRWDAGFQQVTVTTSYPQGTRLHEMTGNAANPSVDPTSLIAEIITVGAGGTVTLRVPNNASSAGNHGRGYVVYAEALPTVGVSIVGSTTTVAPDPVTFPDFLQRLTEMPIVTADTFELRLDTVQTDPLDANSDDNALFRINQGTEDWNGNGSIDISPSTLVIGGYEGFVTENAPAFGSGTGTGVYRQTIDATMLEEGANYISAIAFRKRPAGTTPLFAEERVVVYVDRVPPPVALVEDGQTLDDTSPELRVTLGDRTPNDVYLFADLGVGDDPLTMLTVGNQGRPHDRLEWRKTLNLSEGVHEITIVAVEASGNTNVVTATVTIDTTPCDADVDGNGVLNVDDVDAFVAAFVGGDLSVDFDGNGALNIDDVDAFVASFIAGCG
ncbi:MAG: hypothetical protein DHS20C14_18650 [Phycisphaeraceae bacterium]|nr:MAG: hypothetical protein DHS20C14_18650 [Phycisphaeraceae bacterium]